MQIPLLGEKPGLTHWSTDGDATTSPGPYHSILLEYLQDGTVGRRINVEVRAYDNGVAFRYVVPRTTPLFNIAINDEGTGFSIVGADAVASTKVNTPFDLPFVTATPRSGWVAITDIPLPNFPRMYLVHAGGTALMSRLTPGKTIPSSRIKASRRSPAHGD